LPFSRRKRTATSCQNGNDLAREAVGWNGGLAGGFDSDPQLYLLVPGCSRMPASIERS
jgi:hypothetical protein